MTSAQRKLVEKWARLLRVQDWDITWKEKKRFKGEPQMTGWTRTKTPFRTATIALRKGLPDAEFEVTLVHELLHVVFPSFEFPEGSALFLELEQGVEGLARLLVRLEHGGRGKDSRGRR